MKDFFKNEIKVGDSVRVVCSEAELNEIEIYEGVLVVLQSNGVVTVVNEEQNYVEVIFLGLNIVGNYWFEPTMLQVI